MRRWTESALVAMALVCAVVPLPPAMVERWFSAGVYPRIQHVVTPISNLVPFAIFDVLVAAAAGLTIAALVRAALRARARHSVGPLLATFGHLASGAAIVYLAFLGLWGLNYRRLSMRDRLEVASGGPASDAVVALGIESANRLNALYSEAHRQGWGRPEWENEPLRAAFDVAQRLLSDGRTATPGRLKHTLFGPYFRWTNVDGMVDPFALEVLANPDLLPWERPFVAAHEWAHLAGYADESEANFVGWLTCLRADAPGQYSGWLYLFWEISGEVGSTGRERLMATLGSGPRQDVNAIVARLRRGQIVLLRNTSWMVYDQYLKANRVDEGIRSYGEVVTLILRAKFADGWTPVRRARPSR